MGLISKDFTFAAGATIIASEHNSNFDEVYNEFNGNIENANIKSGAAIDNAKLNLATISQAITFTGNNTFAGTTIANLGTVTTADINGGTLDGTVIGGASAAAGTFTTLKVGTTNQGDILYDNATSIVRLTPGTSGRFLKTNGAGANPAWASAGIPNNIQVFITTDTWTKPADVSTVYVKVWGGGAGGITAGSNSGGGGGGAGGYSEGLTAVSGNVTVTIGAGGAAGNDGGNSSFAGTTTITANGGATGSTTTGGAGGSASNGTINITGQAGGNSIAVNGAQGGKGGSSPMGGGGGQGGVNANASDPDQPGAAGASPGGGGGGGSEPTSGTGGAGAAGMVIVYY